MVAISLLTKHDLESAGKIWRTLERELHPTNITCHWDFISTWIELYGDVVDYWFAVGSVKDEVVGITLITKETHRPLPLPVAAYHIGTNGEPFSDAAQVKHGKILVKKGHEIDFFAAVLKALDTFKWEEIVLDDFDAEVADKIISASRSWIPASARMTIERNKCQVMDLAKLRKDKRTVMDALSNDTRYSIRRSMKALGNDFTVEWAENEEQALAILDELIVLYTHNWNKRGKRGMFASKRFTKFHYEIIRKLLKTDTLLLCRVKSKAYGTLGCLSMTIDGGKAYGYQIGLKDFADVPLEINKKRLRVGFIVHVLCMKEALDRGLDAYNFGVGEYGYKHELTNDVSEVVSVSFKRGFKAKLRDEMVRMYLKSDFVQNIKIILRI